EKRPSLSIEKPTQETIGRQYMPVTGVLSGTGMSGITCEPRASPPTKCALAKGEMISSGAGKIPWSLRIGPDHPCRCTCLRSREDAAPKQRRQPRHMFEK